MPQNRDYSNWSDADANEAFNALINSRMTAGMSKLEATRDIAKKNPQLHARYLLASQQSSRARRDVEDSAKSFGVRN